MKLYLFALLSVTATASARVMEAEVPVTHKINKEGRLTLFNSRRLTDDCLPICQPDSPTDAPVDPPTDAPAGGGGESPPPPIDPTDAPVDPPTDAPVDPTQAPVDPTQAPVDPTQAPVDPTQAPVDPVQPADGECPEGSNWSFKCGTTIFVCGDWQNIVYDADTGLMGYNVESGPDLLELGICSSQEHTGWAEAYYGDAMNGSAYIFPAANDEAGSACDYMEREMRLDPSNGGVKCGEVCEPCEKRVRGKMCQTTCCKQNAVSNFVCYDATPNKYNTGSNPGQPGDCN